MTKALTPFAVRGAKPKDARREVPDGGCRGLYLVVQPSGAKSWVWRYRFAGKPAKLTIGPVYLGDDEPEVVAVGRAATLAGARKLAGEAALQVAKGINPTGEKREAKAARRAADANTFEVIAIEYLKRVCGAKVGDDGTVTFDAAARKKKRTGPERHATLQRAVFPEIGTRPIGEIKKSEIVKLLDTIEDESGSVMADRTLALIRTIMNWHATRDDDFRSPIVRGMARTKPKERARKRILADDEIRDIWAALDTAEDLPGCYPAYVRMVLFTATRRNEAARMSTAEINGDLWTIPGERYKTGLDHVVPLTPKALALIGGKPEGFKGNSWLVFSTTGGKKPFSGFSKAKKALDKKIAEIRKADDREPMPRWTLHDLRRVARSLMSRAKVPADHAERALGHVIGGVRETYDRHEYLDEKRAAFEALAVLVDMILKPPADNVVQFPQVVGE